jgi:hypothetical protein
MDLPMPLLLLLPVTKARYPISFRSITFQFSRADIAPLNGAV